MSSGDITVPVFLGKSYEPKVGASFGAIEGAKTFTRELASWSPDPRPIDYAGEETREIVGSRARDLTLNDPYVASAINGHKDAIVGHQYRLNAQPVAAVLGAPDGWEEEFQVWAELRFNLLAQSSKAWFDAGRRMTLVDMVRLSIGTFVLRGEVAASAEWLPRVGRPFSSAVQMFAASRISNPNQVPDRRDLRGGVALGPYGEPITYFVRQAQQYDPLALDRSYQWTSVPAYKPWGRPQMLHLFEPIEPEQNRGVAAIVAALKGTRIAQRYTDVQLQNMVANAMYAAVIESDLTPEMVMSMMGGEAGGAGGAIDAYAANVLQFAKDQRAVAIDGIKIPHLYPGTKLHMQPAAKLDETGFEDRLYRRLAAGFGMSAESFTGDFTKTNYSSARASFMLEERRMRSKKRMAADRLANFVYELWLEEMWSSGECPRWAGAPADLFWQSGMREAFLAAEWIGSSRGQIDEGKETDAALARMDAGISTLEQECGRLGQDYRYVIRQRAREKKMLADAGLNAPMRQGLQPGAQQQPQTQATA